MYLASLPMGLACLLLPLLVRSQDSENPSSGPSSDNSGSGSVDDAAGGSGTNTGFVNLSTGATIAIIVVAVVVGIGGISSAVLFYLAKKRQWEIRRSIRRSARRLTGNFTNAKARSANRKASGLSRLADDPPRKKNVDIEKGNTKVTSTFEIESPTSQPWTSKVFAFAKKPSR
ncbi:MAG: hypothetical protein M4579_007066 [Chaenotheca gracillima]|nr:MAG: hypothetical protein M4579_007066 [Chaenotheca gracillima]